MQVQPISRPQAMALNSRSVDKIRPVETSTVILLKPLTGDTFRPIPLASHCQTILLQPVTTSRSVIEPIGGAVEMDATK